MSDYSELVRQCNEQERQIALQKIEIEALLSQNYDLKREMKLAQKNFEHLEAAKDDSEDWVYFGHMCAEEFMQWAIEQSKRFMDQDSRYAWELANDLKAAQYRIEDFMEVLAKAATRSDDE